MSKLVCIACNTPIHCSANEPKKASTSLWLVKPLAVDHHANRPSWRCLVRDTTITHTFANSIQGCGIECVIAKSFAFIFQRNMPNLGLLGITMPNESFYAAAKDGSEISIDLRAHVIHIDGLRFEFELSQMEQELFRHGGITSAFRKFGNSLFEELTAAKNVGTSHKKKDCHAPNELQW